MLDNAGEGMIPPASSPTPLDRDDLKSIFRALMKGAGAHGDLVASLVVQAMVEGLSEISRTILSYLALPSLAGHALHSEEEHEDEIRMLGADSLSPNPKERSARDAEAEQLHAQYKALDLILLQLKEVRVQLEVYSDPGRVFISASVLAVPSQPLALSRLEPQGSCAAFARALLLLLVHLIQRSNSERPPAIALEWPAMTATMETMTVLARDRQFQHLLLRQWEEAEAELGQSLQEFLLERYTQWSTPRSSSSSSPPSSRSTRRVQSWGEGNEVPSSAPCAALLQLWVTVAAQRPVEISAGGFVGLGTVVLSPVLTGESGTPALGSSTLVTSLELLGHAIRGSGSFRNFVRAHNSREKYRVYTSLLSLVAAAQQRDGGTDLVMAALGCLARLVANDSHYEERIFDKRNIEQMSRLVLGRLLEGLPGGPNFSTDDSDDGSFPDTVCKRSLSSSAADVLIDMLRSPLILTTLEADADRLSRFMVKAVAAIHGLTQQRVARRPSLIARCEHLLRALRTMCQESHVAQTLFVRRLLDDQDHTALSQLFELALCDNVSTACEAAGLLHSLVGADAPSSQRSHPHMQYITGLRTGTIPQSLRNGVDDLRKLQATVESVLLAGSYDPAILPKCHNRPCPRNLSAPPVLADCQRGPGDLLDRLVERLHVVIGGFEQAEGASESQLTLPVSLEHERPLQSLLTLSCALARRVELAPALASRLDPRCIGSYIFALVHLRALRVKERQALLPQRQANLTATLGLASERAIEPMEVVVLGVTLLLQLHAATRDAAEVVQGTSGKDTSGSYGRWASTLLSSTKVADVVYAAATQPWSKQLAQQAMDVLAMANARGGADWAGLVDSFFVNSQRRSSCLEDVVQRLEEAEAGVQTLTSSLKQKSDVLEAEQDKVEALKERHAKEMEDLRCALMQQLQEARHALKTASSDYKTQAAEIANEIRRLEDRGREAQNRYLQEQLEHGLTKEEVATLRKQVTAFTEVLQKMEEHSSSSEHRARSVEQDLEDLKQGLLEKDLLRIEAEGRLEEASKARADAETKLEDTYAKLIALAKAYKTKEETCKRTDVRLHQLDSQVRAAEAHLTELRLRLEDSQDKAAAMRAELQGHLSAREHDVRTAEHELSQAREELQRCRSTLEGKSAEAGRLERQLQEATEALDKRERAIKDKEEQLRKYADLAAMINKMTASSQGSVGDSTVVTGVDDYECGTRHR